jgi:hypothetical protein
MHGYTLTRAIRRAGFPAHPNPFGPGWIFYWSEIEEWLRNPQAATPTARAVPRVPRKTPAATGAGKPRAQRARSTHEQ